jgi:hypothetical protein
MLKTILKGTGYTVFFLVAVGFFAIVSLPTEKARLFLQHKASDAIAKKWPGAKVTIEALDINGLSGITLKNVEILIPVPLVKTPDDHGRALPGAPSNTHTPTDDKDAKANRTKRVSVPGLIMADEVTVKFNSWDAMLGKPITLVIDSKIEGGIIEGLELPLGKKGFHLKTDKIKDVELGRTRITKKMFGVDIAGQLSGRLAIDWTGNPKTTNFKIDLTITDATVSHFPIHMGKGKQRAKIGDAFDMDLGTLQIRIEPSEETSRSKRGRRAFDTRKPMILKIAKLASRGGAHAQVALVNTGRPRLVYRGGSFGDMEWNFTLAIFLRPTFFQRKATGFDETGQKLVDHDHTVLYTGFRKGSKKGSFRMPDGALAKFARATGKEGTPQEGYQLGMRCSGPIKLAQCTWVRLSTANLRRMMPVADRAARPSTVGGKRPNFRRPTVTPRAGTPPRSGLSSRSRPPSRAGKSPRSRLTERTRPGRDARRRKPFRSKRARSGAPGDSIAPGLPTEGPAGEDETLEEARKEKGSERDDNLDAEKGDDEDDPDDESDDDRPDDDSDEDDDEDPDDDPSQ